MQSETFRQFDDYCIRHSIVTRAWTAVPQSQVLEVPGYIKNSTFVHTDFLLYIRTDRSDDWWGITYTVFEKLVASGRRWWLVLLGDAEDGYLLNGTQVDAMRGQFSRGTGQYHVHEKNAAKGLRFHSFEELRRALTQP